MRRPTRGYSRTLQLLTPAEAASIYLRSSRTGNDVIAFDASPVSCGARYERISGLRPIMLNANLFAFIGAAFVLTVTPGLDTAMVLRTVASEGARHGMSAAFGIGVGCLCWGVAVALGLGALLLASPTAFGIMKFAGAAYLVWLGLHLLLRPRRSISEIAVTRMSRSDSLWLSASRGFTTNILNPKVGLFYLTLLPQFVPAAHSTTTYSLLFAAVHVVLAVVWFIVLAVVAGAVRRKFARPGVLPLIDRVTGGVFLGFGLHLVVN